VAAWVAVSLVSLVPLAYQPPSWSPRALLALFTALPGTESGMLLHTWRATASLLLGVGAFWAVRRSFGGRSLRPLGLGLAAGLGVILAIGLLELLGWVDLWGYRPIGEAMYDTRLHSLFFHSGWLAEYLVLTTPLAVAALALGGRWSRIGAAGLAVTSVACLVFSQQRGAWIAVLIQLAALLLLMGGGRVRRMTLIVVVLAGLSVAGISYLRPNLARPVIDRMERITSDLSGRTQLWEVAATLTAERPVLGWGVGGFAAAYDRHRPPGEAGAWRFRGTAHSLYLNTSVERGALGLLALLSMAWAAWSGLRQAAAGRPGERTDLATALMVSGIGLVVYGMVQYVFYLKNLELLFWLLLGMSSVLMAGTVPGIARRLAQLVIVVAALLVPWRLLAVEPLDSPTDRSFGVHEPEHGAGDRDFRWLAGRAAWRVERQGETLLMEIVDGHPRAWWRDVEVVVVADGREVWRGRAPIEWQTLELSLGPSDEEYVTLDVSARPTFRPFSDYRRYPDLAPSRDIRELGLVLGELSWAEPPAAPSPRTP